MASIALIGMPGIGKSTVGVLLAKALGLRFIDTDLILQEIGQKRLQQLVDQLGVDGFLRFEEETIAALPPKSSVIATGGSAIYGPRAMAHLKQLGTVVYLRAPYETIEKRLYNLTSRGIAMRPGQTLKTLYEQRVPLYEAEADLTLDVAGYSMQQTVEALIRLCEEKRLLEVRA